MIETEPGTKKKICDGGWITQLTVDQLVDQIFPAAVLSIMVASGIRRAHRKRSDFGPLG